MQQNISRQNNYPKTELDFFDILRILLNSKRLIIILTLAAALIGFIYSNYFSSEETISYESVATMEIGSYPADDKQASRDGRNLIASMQASTTLLNAIYGYGKKLGGDENPSLGNKKYNSMESKASTGNENLQKINIYELDNQYFVIAVYGTSLESVKNKTLEIVDYIKELHAGRLSEVISKKAREQESIEERLATIDLFISDIEKDNNLYISDVAELKLKEIEYGYILKELRRHLDNVHEFRPTGLIKKIEFSTYVPGDNKIKITLASCIIGFVLSLLFVFIRYALARYDEE